VSFQAVRRKGRNADYVKLALTPELILEANDILVISGNSEATDLAEAKLLWDFSNRCFDYFFFLMATGLRVSNGAR